VEEQEGSGEFVRHYPILRLVPAPSGEFRKDYSGNAVTTLIVLQHGYDPVN